MTPQQLKNSILQRAIEGRLVPQKAEDGTAKELLQKIQAEKAQLIAEKKIKKTKALPPISDEEIPFDIPDDWEWIRLGEICTYDQTKEKISKENILSDMWSLDMEDIEKGTGRIINIEKAGNRKIAGDKVVFHKGDILYSKLRPYLQKILIAPADGICTSELVPFHCYGDVNSYYITWLLRSAYVNQIANAESYGVKMPRVSKETMIKILVPLPPLAEQHRIVAKIEELLPFIDKYDKAYNKLMGFNARFPEDMKKSILQYAIEGKLVEQRKEEGTADALLQQIQAEKKRLIEEKKIKKTKPLPPITEEEIPFDIPDSWKWVRWGDLTYSIQYGYNAPAKANGRIKMVRISDIQNSKVLWDIVPYCDIDEDSIETYLLQKNDILFARTGGTVGKSYLVTDVLEESIYAGYLIRTRYSDLLVPQYLKFFMETSIYWEQLRNGTIATAQPNCNGKTLANMILPLPPIREQRRIVAKIEELLPLCEQLIK